ncbi:uncharacterized protein M421DRAFT_385139 [Didymella exigua CBS 183.55]|uniref:Mid2 domain-containing protein n=1 Tax=Didymella exigua CBS 183.55 TaxID=1150837 RepID=A0A6A5RR62_9PLEO|nr:uncharacterized protein M421DRAFT_385139 [Didymella exigua CBS 183.55]KAF1930119.1 hypothetical protein M421DRAFT_385139 [Didymella exigua CBS 183.55]
MLRQLQLQLHSKRVLYLIDLHMLQQRQYRLPPNTELLWVQLMSNRPILRLDLQCAERSTTSTLSGTLETTSSSNDDTDKPENGLSQSNIIAIGVGLGVGIPALAISFISMCLACPCCPWAKRRRARG